MPHVYDEETAVPARPELLETPAQGAALQMKGGYEAQSRALSPFAVAESGLQGGASQLPHLDQVQRAFGKYDVSSVQYYGGEQAAKANQTLGSQAFAYGDKVAGNGPMDVATTAHEAAHVIQQRAGKTPASGIGSAGDSYERHADEVADAAVSGRSAEGILDQMTGGDAAAQSGATAVQTKALQPFLGGLSDMASSAWDAFSGGGAKKDDGGDSASKSKSKNKKDEPDEESIWQTAGRIIGQSLAAGATASSDSEGSQKQGPVRDSKGRKLPGFDNQATQLDGLIKMLKKLESWTMVSYEVTKKVERDDISDVPTHYKISDPFHWNGGFEGEYYDCIKHLQDRIKDSRHYSPSAVWLPSWAPKEAKDYLDNEEYPRGKRSSLFIEEGTGVILWVDDRGPHTKYEMMALMPANIEIYEAKAIKAGIKKDSPHGAKFLKEQAMINNRDYLDLVVCQLKSPTQARKFLKGVGKDVALVMASGLMNLMGPQVKASGTPFATLNQAVADYAGWGASRVDGGSIDSIKPKEQSEWVPEQNGNYWDDGECVIDAPEDRKYSSG